MRSIIPGRLALIGRWCVSAHQAITRRRGTQRRYFACFRPIYKGVTVPVQFKSSCVSPLWRQVRMAVLPQQHCI